MLLYQYIHIFQKLVQSSSDFYVFFELMQTHLKCRDMASCLLIYIDFGIYMSFLRILYLYWLFHRGLRMCGRTFSYIPQALLPWAVSLTQQQISIWRTARRQTRRTSRGAFLEPRLAWLLLVLRRWLRRPAALLSALEVVPLQNRVLRLGRRRAERWINVTVGFRAVWMFSR